MSIDQELVTRVATRLLSTPSATDHLVLTKWRLMLLCQHLVGGLNKERGDACRAALDAFATYGPGVECDQALRAAGLVLGHRHGPGEAVLPSISPEKCTAVSAQLQDATSLGVVTIERALRELPLVRESIRTALHSVLLPGMRHRFELVANVVEDPTRPEHARARAAAAVLYVHDHVARGTAGLIEIIDHDYALRVVIRELGLGHGIAILHWSEVISSLSEDLPFLQGVNLRRGDSAIPVTWLDRVNSYVAYLHALDTKTDPLILLQPSITCSPLHAIVSLIGLLVLDAVTSSQRKVDPLVVGQTYTFDRHVAIFEGIATDERYRGWIRLRFRDGNSYARPSLADQMVPTKRRALSDGGEFQSAAPGRDPLRRFFGWESPIGRGSVSSHIVLVASRRRVLEILGDVQSNGVALLDDELTRYVGGGPDGSDMRGSVLLVVPSLRAVRLLLEREVRVHSVVIVGYDRLYCGRHDLPFLISSTEPPPVICWSAAGYFPFSMPKWLPQNRCLEVSSDDLLGILELDDASTDLAHASLWEAATGAPLRTHPTPISSTESAIEDAIDVYLETVRSSAALPDYWRYYLTAPARTLRLLISATPAEWAVIRNFSLQWSSLVDERWASLRRGAVSALSDIREAETRVQRLIEGVSGVANSRAEALGAFSADPAHQGVNWHLVCDRPEQVRASASVFRAMAIRGVEPVLLGNLSPCASCIVMGWVSFSFARRLWAHTPATVVALADEKSHARWERAAQDCSRALGASVLSGVNVAHFRPARADRVPDPAEERADSYEATDEPSPDEHVPCVFLWVAGKSEAKVLQPDARVVAQEGEAIRERSAGQIRPDDRVILGTGTSRWSPADEFTSAVIQAVGSSHPELVDTAKEWRRALGKLAESERLSTSQVRARLESIGVGREEQTIEGWLDVERASPIAPRGVIKELAALWPLVHPYAKHSLDEVAVACTRLRSLRLASGHALLRLWKGRTADIRIDETWLEELVHKLRDEVEVHEVVSVGFGEVPRAMLGWWVPPALAGKFESALGAVMPHEPEEEAGAMLD